MVLSIRDGIYDTIRYEDKSHGSAPTAAPATGRECAWRHAGSRVSADSPSGAGGVISAESRLHGYKMGSNGAKHYILP